jgi:quinol monooxygenase YgiN
VLIIAGSLILDPADRDRFLAASAAVVPQARRAPGCLDFVQAADPIDTSRINIFEC